VPFLLAVRAQEHGTIDDSTALDATALNLLDGRGFVVSGTSAWAWHLGAFVAVARIVDAEQTGVAIVLDDSESAIQTGIKESWRTWLQLSNLLGLRPTGTEVTVRSLVTGAPAPEFAATVDAGDGVTLDPAWMEVIAQATGEERPFLRMLAQHGVPLPESGPEVGGIPLGPSWLDRKITVDVDLGDDERGDLAALGWTVVTMDVDAVVAALQAGVS